MPLVDVGAHQEVPRYLEASDLEHCYCVRKRWAAHQSIGALELVLSCQEIALIYSPRPVL